MITLDEYFNHWKANYGHVKVDLNQLTEEMRISAAETVAAANRLLERFGEPSRDLTSGWRPEEVNARVTGAAKRSQHTRCCAIDIADPDGDLDNWCMEHRDVLVDLGLYLEHPSATNGWCHVQIVPPRSGNRVFLP